jgi:hypothetical protein
MGKGTGSRTATGCDLPMIIDCIGFPMGFFIGVTEDGRVVFGKRDPVTKEVLEIYEYKPIRIEL